MPSRLLKPFIRREIRSRQDLTGRVMTAMTLREFNTGSAPVWVCDVDLGSNRLMRDVPIKGNANGSRFYAQRGQTVLMRRNTQGRYDIIGPADRLTAAGNVKTYTLGNGTPVTNTPQGFSFELVPFEFYKGTGTSLWNDGTTPFPYVRLLDALGNPV
jgi:hypothetical protein